MGFMMTVGELKAALLGVPDSTLVVVEDQAGNRIDDAYSAYPAAALVSGPDPAFVILTQKP